MIYAWGGIWAAIYLIFPPAATLNVLSQATVYLWTIASILGALTAVAGLLTRDNLLMERLGVHLLMVAPIVYGLTQLGLFVYGFYDNLPTDPFDRFHLIFLALWPFFFLNKRRRQLKARVADAKGAPLPSESAE